MTLLTTMLDFTDTGEIGLLVTEEGVAAREAAIGKGGLLKGSELAQVFASLRANDLIWPYVVKGYLKGQAPPAFDLLYWNSDDTNLPGPMFCWYLRNTLPGEQAPRAGRARCSAAQPVDLGTIDVPTFVYASKEDHIVPWKTAYASTQLLSGDATFVLGASGHIAGVINPPAKNKRNYWVASGAGAADDAARRDSGRPRPAGSRPPRRCPGSWWPTWYAWLAPHGGPQVTAHEAGRATPSSPPVEEAPGSYVREKAG